MACKDVVKERGLDRVTVEDLVQVEKLLKIISLSYISFQEVGPKGSQMVPDDIRKELLKDIKKFLEDQAED